MSLPIGPEQNAFRVGPRRPMPFPDSGKRVKLINCTKCSNLGVLFYYAPYERGYPTACIKCGARFVIKPKGTSVTDIQHAGGFTPRLPGIRTNHRWGLDGTRFYDERRDMSSIGMKRAYQQGFVPTPIDQALR